MRSSGPRSHFGLVRRMHEPDASSEGSAAIRPLQAGLSPKPPFLGDTCSSAVTRQPDAKGAFGGRCRSANNSTLASGPSKVTVTESLKKASDVRETSSVRRRNRRGHRRRRQSGRRRHRRQNDPRRRRSHRARRLGLHEGEPH